MDTNTILTLIVTTLVTGFIAFTFWMLQSFISQRKEKKDNAEKEKRRQIQEARKEEIRQREEATEEESRKREELRKALLGPNGIPPKDLNEAVIIAKNEGRNVRLPVSTGINLFFILACMAFGALYLTERVRQSPPQPNLTIDTDPNSNLLVSVRIIEIICNDAKKIDYSLVELSITGGTPPYNLTITNSERELSGPFTVVNNNSPVRIKVYGGDYFTSVIQSNAGEIWSGTIGLPIDSEFCKIVATPSEKYPFDVTVTNTTEFVQVTNTLIVHITDTVRPEITITLPPPPTDTPIPQPTETSRPQPTGTPIPQSTDTSRPQPTDTPIPQPTITPTPINPHPRECEDGIDNDDDGLIDYGKGPLNDPQCKKPSDNHEDK